MFAFLSNCAEQKSHFVAKSRSVVEETNHSSNAAPKINLKSKWTAVEAIRLIRASVYAAMKVQCGG